MASAPVIWREPDSFVSGDTLIFNRNLPNYLPSDGWFLQLTLNMQVPAGVLLVVQVNSAPDATNAFHTFNVPNFAAGRAAGNYILTLEAINAGTGEQHQIFFNDNFKLTAAGGAVLALTQAQQMLQTIGATLLELYAHKFSETDVQRNRFILQDIDKLETAEKYWTHKRQQEVQIENARNGRATGTTSVPVFSII